jgi:hypothetical protein
MPPSKEGTALVRLLVKLHEPHARPCPASQAQTNPSQGTARAVLLTGFPREDYGLGVAA